MITYKCYICKTDKPLTTEYFHKDCTVNTGFKRGCKVCINKKKKERDARSQDKIKAYREANKDKMKEYRKKHHDRNKEKDNAKNKEYYNRNKEKIAAKVKERYGSEEWKAFTANKASRRRELRKARSDGTLPLTAPMVMTDDLLLLLEKQDYKCHICHTDISKDKHLDHWVPLSKGGAHSIENVVWLCPTCNLKKSDKMPSQLILI